MIDYQYSDLFLTNAVKKDWTIVAKKNNTTVITLTNNDLINNSITIDEAISTDGLVFGRCESSKITFTVHGVTTNLKGCELEVDVVLGGHTEAPFRVGTYKVTSDLATADRYHRKIEAYDALADINSKDVSEWYKGLTFPMTIKQFRDSFFNYVGVTQETIELINDNISIPKTVDDESKIPGSTIVSAICEINGCFGHISRDNKFVYKSLEKYYTGLYPANDLYPKDTLYPREEDVNSKINRNHWYNIEYEDYMVKKIDGVVILDDEGNIAVTTSVTATNPLNISDNFLLYNLETSVLTTIANNLFNHVKHIEYIPYNIDCMADLCAEVGDSIRINSKEKVIYSYIFARSVSGLVKLDNSIEATGDETRTEDYNSISAQLQRLANKSKYDLEASNARITNLEADHVSVEDLEAESARITELSADVVIVRDALYAQTIVVNEIRGTVDSQGQSIINIQSDVTNIGGRVSSAEQSILNINTDITNINSTVTNIGNRTSSNETSIANINTDITNIKSNVTTIGNTVDSHGNSLSSLSGSINSINSTLSSHGQTLSSHNQSILDNAQSITNITTDVTNITSELTIVKNLAASKISASEITSSFLASKFTSASAAQFAFFSVSYATIGSLQMSDEGAVRVFAPMTVDGHRVLAWR